ncbi:hypothetical protein BV25DRAFT_1986459 [Artomyces pyxidatus]|uniref:Uncharacterized protein n=1 Tax=Artomyces pyxidatus TaxID=48021 RepID=A0ACB8TKC3_9AGAM|nr:hypothetical protein BV25DRAFT_1986459 [Artomyces pyxidatus]
MASLSSVPPVSASRTTDWGRSGERGSAFRGMSRGRGGTGGGRGDRGRGGRGGGRSGGRGGGRSDGEPSPLPDAGTKATNVLASAKSEASSIAPSDSVSSSRSSFSTRPPPLNSIDHATRSKPATRRASGAGPRKVPSLNVEPASPTVHTFVRTSQPPSPNATRPVPRRRRSHQSTKVGHTSSSLGDSLSVDTMPPPMKSRKSQSGPSSPLAPSKDAPPHLSAGPTVTTFSSKENIDSLVERVRAMAMDHNRPSTPGSHIDWAGDDDDTLPDLDDWGVPSSATATSGTSTDTGLSEGSKLELMSPILDDSLKQLPHDFEKPKPFSVGENTSSLAEASIHPSGDMTPGSRHDKSVDDCVHEVPKQAVSFKKPETADNQSTPQQKGRINGRPKPVSVEHPSKLSPKPLHPSLPAKPVSAPTPSPPHRSGVSHTSLSPRPAAPSSAASERGLAESIHAPSRATPRGDEDDVDTGKAGLLASIHAPKASSSESELSSLVPPHTAPPFNPTHGRSRTLGRPPHSAGGSSKTHRSFPSGASTPNAANTHHSRTQSTPPATVGRHARHSSRPVITGDAISRLARTLGSPPPKRDAPAAAASSE